MTTADVPAAGTERKTVQLLNVRVDDVTLDDLVRDFREGTMLTLHVDMIMKLQRDREFYDLLSKFDVITCDSQVLYFASRFLGTPVATRVSGSDFFPLYYAHHKDNPDVTIFICGGQRQVAERARQRINDKVGRKMIVGTCSPPRDFENDPAEIERIIAAVNNSRATVLMVGLGGGRQEKFMLRYRDRFQHVHTFLPLGGTIDYEAQTLPRPPAWITNCGLEWLYRLIREPRQRWHRYLVHQPPVLWLLLLQRFGLYRNPFARPEAGAESH